MFVHKISYFPFYASTGIPTQFSIPLKKENRGVILSLSDLTPLFSLVDHIIAVQLFLKLPLVAHHMHKCTFH